MRARQEAEGWCDRFAANTDKWPKSTVVSLKDNEPDITYEDIDTSSILRGHVFMDLLVPKSLTKSGQRDSAETSDSA